MSPATRKDVFTAFRLHPVPVHLSTKEFAAKLEALADSMLALPVAQECFRKFELMIPNDRFDTYFKALGFPPARPMVIVKAEYETAEHCAQFFSDAKAIGLLSKAEEFVGASVFSADESTRIDIDRSTDGSGNWIGIFKCPPDLSPSEHCKKAGDVADKIAALPIMQRNIVKHTMWFQNEDLSSGAQVLGMPPPDPMVILLLESDLQPMIEVWPFVFGSLPG
ncbi:hypothetical protein K438DRAFT_1960743 [Mycena galopus ATCC 62051]|nr:hypothetical protein K438DRAFT_1960743 [Mycena galopus ATCC 62051]